MIAVAVSLVTTAGFAEPPTFISDGSSNAGGSKPPVNVVLIVSDDQTYTDFGFMGNERVHTPHLDELASQSARFTHGYVPSSVCRPSLVTILTGLYPHEHGVFFNHPPPGFAKLSKSPEISRERFDAYRGEAESLIRNVPTLPRILAGQGFRSLQTGKFWEGHHRNAGFTDGMTTATPSGGKYGDLVLASGDVVAHGNGDHGLAIGRETMRPIEAFLDEVVSESSPSPFLIWYAPFLPHVPHDSPERFVRLAKSRPNVKPHELPYFAAIAQFDETIGQLRSAIEKRGLAKQTLFVFVVDNGWQPDAGKFRQTKGEWDHTDNSKRAPFDAGLRTPILFHLPGRTVPATYEAPVSSIDLLPTILAATGVGPPNRSLPNRSLPGVNLWPVATGQAPADGERAVFGELYPGDARELGKPEQDIAYRWVRRGRYKLIVPHAHAGHPPWGGYLTRPALFDISSDPGEARDLSRRPGYQAVRDELNSLLDQWWAPGP
ncbi:Arylsulfatase precursor [Neorhodopirellula pilleata]|uniref:Arylsulfatase n=2 Tax=Neorhodopirellula pilleata TaxID=2714738 RepID=A0A5C6A6F0_9BACT|nr:Arylsulfatase precursor [Neorhodopirellula pilleata]